MSQYHISAKQIKEWIKFRDAFLRKLGLTHIDNQ